MYIIDRFEGDWAVIEMNRQIVNLPKSLLPSDAKEGDVIEIHIKVDVEMTEERQKNANKLLDNFFDK